MNAAPARPSAEAKRPAGPASLERLRELVVDEQRLREAIDVEVDSLAAAGVNWPRIAAVLGVTRQAARQRHARRHEPQDSPQQGVADRLAS